MSSDQIVFFDLASKPPNSTWSFNPWKTRLLLNYKGLDYRTEWLEFPAIKPRLENLVAPHEKEPGAIAQYTVPAITLPNGTTVMDSDKIARIIAERYPSPALPVDTPRLEKVQGLVQHLMGDDLVGFLAVYIPERMLNEASVHYWHVQRPKDFGMPLRELYRAKGGLAVWTTTARTTMRTITGMLNENSEGPLFEGKDLTYADFVWAGALLFLKRFGDDVWERTLGATGDAKATEEFLGALRPWTERCTY